MAARIRCFALCNMSKEKSGVRLLFFKISLKAGKKRCPAILFEQFNVNEINTCFLQMKN